VSKIVLCVDDSATMQQVADITFRGTEFTYVGARSYEEGLEKAKAQKPAVVLADSVMPGGKSGYDLCLALKQNDSTANVPVVILIGNGAPFDNAKGVQVGADANLPKPWDTQTMLEKVTEVVTKAAGGVAKPGQPAAGAAATPVAAAASQPAAVAAASKTAPTSPANQPPRSATIMGMPTIKMPAGVAPSPTTNGPAKTAVMSVPMVAPATPSAPAPAMTTPGTGGGMRTPAATPASVAAAPVLSIAGRAPMISGSPSKRSQIVERTLAKMAARLAEASGLEPGSPELAALLKLSTEVVERIVWEVVPELAEQIIRENLHELTARRS
jgi:CheY-like chemotaxis protein